MKVLASDFDGTILFKYFFKIKDIFAIKKFQKNGHLIGLCTGRPLNGVLKYTKNIILFDFYILSTGSVILDKEFNVFVHACVLIA